MRRLRRYATVGLVACLVDAAHRTNRHVRPRRRRIRGRLSAHRGAGSVARRQRRRSRRDASAADSRLSLVSRRAARRTQPLTFGRYAALADDDVWPAEIVGELRARLKYANGPLARSLSAAAFEALLERPMRAVENAEPARRPVPVARDRPRPLLRITGHVRRAGRIFGRPRLRRSDGPARRHAHRNPEAHRARPRDADSRSRVRHRACAGDSRSSIRSGSASSASIKAAWPESCSRCATATSTHSSAWTRAFNIRRSSGLPRSSPHYDELRTARSLAARRQQADGPAPAGTQSLFEEAIHSDRYWLRVAALGHADFTSYALVEGRGEGPATGGR